MHLRPHPDHNPVTTFFLNSLSLFYKTFSLLALGLRSLKRKAFPDVFIISVDNLSFGGTGKTPLVISIGKKLEEKKIKFAIISRGYRSGYEKKGIRVSEENSVEEVGDEAVLFKSVFPGQDVWIGRNRHRSIEKAVKNNNKIIILDDGFQSRGIEKNLKIMLLNPGHPYYYLRNFRWLAREEDVVLTFQPSFPSRMKSGTGESPLIQGYYTFKIENFYNSKNRAVDVKQEPIVGFSAVGDNLRFQKDLSSFNLVAFKPYPDHYPYSEKEIQNLDAWRKREQASYLVCTRKDFIKLSGFDLERIPLLYLENRLQFSIDVNGIIINHAEKKGII